MAKRAKCPHCGNTNPDTIDSNGHGERLCVAKVKPADAAVLVYGFDPKTDTDERGMVACGQQWEVAR